MLPVIRTKEQAIAEIAGDLRLLATRLEEHCYEPRDSILPPPAAAPRLSIGQSLRTKRVHMSIPAAGAAWVGIATLVVEVVRELLRMIH